MIKTVKDLQAYLLKDADEFEELRMTSPGCLKEEVEELKKALPGIPDSYTKWVEAVNLNGIDVGYFGVSPFSFNPKGMVANLIEGNEEGVMFWEQMKKYHLYSVGSCSDVGIFVATASSPYKEAEIIAIEGEIYIEKENPEKWIHKLARDFEQFLIIAGNLNQIHREIKMDDPNYNNKREKEFFDRLRKLGVSEEYDKAWRFFL